MLIYTIDITLLPLDTNIYICMCIYINTYIFILRATNEILPCQWLENNSNFCLDATILFRWHIKWNNSPAVPYSICFAELHHCRCKAKNKMSAE